MMKNCKKMNTKISGKIIKYSLLALFVGSLFTTDLKTDDFGFLQRGFLKIGLFNPDADDMDTAKKAQTTNTQTYETYHLILEDQNGNTLKMSDLEGKVVFINFWATWCPPCIAEMPNINKLYQNYGNDDQVVFLMISLDRNFDKAKRFLHKKDFNFDIYYPKSNIPKAFESRGIPNTFVLAKDGSIAYSKMGMGNYNTTKFKNFLEDLKSK